MEIGAAVGIRHEDLCIGSIALAALPWFAENANMQWWIQAELVANMDEQTRRIMEEMRTEHFEQNPQRDEQATRERP